MFTYVKIGVADPYSLTSDLDLDFLVNLVPVQFLKTKIGNVLQFNFLYRL
jgi:hypothetical protein